MAQEPNPILDRHIVKQEVLERLRLMLALVLDASFIGLWLLLQWGLEITERYLHVHLDSIDQFELTTARLFFSLSTAAPIAIFTVRDIAKLIIRAVRDVRSEMK